MLNFTNRCSKKKFLQASMLKGITLKSMKHLLISATFLLLFLSSCNTRHGRIFEKKSSYIRNLCHWGQIGLSSINLDWFIWLPPMNISFSAPLFPKPPFHSATHLNTKYAIPDNKRPWTFLFLRAFFRPLLFCSLTISWHLMTCDPSVGGYYKWPKSKNQNWRVIAVLST